MISRFERQLVLLAFSLLISWSAVGDLGLGPQQQELVEVHHLPLEIRSVNFVTGVPLTGLGSTTGGFGDVASNVFSAIEYKRRNPNVKVTIIVTSFQNRDQHQVMTSNEIMKVMFPSLDPKITDKPQKIGAVEVLFLNEDPYQLSNKARQKEPIEVLRARLKAVIPAADVSIQYSANNSAMIEALNANAKISISAYEPSEHRGSFKLVESRGHQSPTLNLIAGATGLGYYIENNHAQTGDSKSGDFEKVSQWLAEKFQAPLHAEDKILLAYSAEVASTKLYLAAAARMARARPNEKFRLITKIFPGLDKMQLPSNLIVHASDKFSHGIFGSIVKISAYSPLVTGDTSLSMALSHTTKERNFVYEVPEWKYEAAITLQQVLAKEMGVEPSELKTQFLFESRETNTPGKFEEAADLLAKSLLDSASNAKKYTALKTLVKQWDALDNTHRAIDVYRQFQFEWHNKLLSTAYAQHIMNELKIHKTWDGTLKNALEILSQKSPPIETRFFSALLVLKLKKDLSSTQKNYVSVALAKAYESENFRDQLKILGAYAKDRQTADILRQGGATPAADINVKVYMPRLLGDLADAIRDFNTRLSIGAASAHKCRALFAN